MPRSWDTSFNNLNPSVLATEQILIFPGEPVHSPRIHASSGLKHTGDEPLLPPQYQNLPGTLPAFVAEAGSADSSFWLSGPAAGPQLQGKTSSEESSPGKEVRVTMINRSR